VTQVTLLNASMLIC